MWLYGCERLKKARMAVTQAGSTKASASQVQSRVLGNTKLLFPRGGHSDRVQLGPWGKGAERRGKVKIKNSLVAVFSERDRGKIARQ